MLRDIMVHLDLAPTCQGRVDAAVTLAKQHGASLTGLHVYSAPHTRDAAQQTAVIQARFREATDQTGIGTDFLAVDLGFSQIGIAEMIGYYASFTDLLVISQPHSVDRDQEFSVIASPERLLLGSGRPVLVVPEYGTFSHIGERIMVAWKAGPKASRALHDAMPLLRTAGYVSMVSVDKAPFSADESERLQRHLARHGIKSGIELIPPGVLSIGDTLLNLVTDDNIDLMVIGVHILTRRGHLDMGAVAGFLLGQMTVPILLSH
jgi:nucleotide-binding universal stress UspA family protein